MADIITDDKYYNDIADALRTNLGTEDVYKPHQMAKGVADSYQKGEADGYSEGLEDGITQGKQAEYDAFWNMFQQNGARTSYRYAFFNWDGAYDTFKPKYDIKPVGDIQAMFQDFNTYISLPSVCEKQGIVMDFSKVTRFYGFLWDSSIYRVGTIDCSSATTLEYAFYNASSLTTIDKLILHEGITSYSYTFTNAANLQNLTIEGVIAGNYFSFSIAPKVSHDSLMSVINHLKDYSGTGTTKTITFGATNLAKLTDAEKAIATDKGWTLA